MNRRHVLLGALASTVAAVTPAWAAKKVLFPEDYQGLTNRVSAGYKLSWKIKHYKDFEPFHSVLKFLAEEKKLQATSWNGSFRNVGGVVRAEWKEIGYYTLEPVDIVIYPPGAEGFTAKPGAPTLWEMSPEITWNARL